MSTTYLLLRNNKQTGPYSLEALLQQGLQPHDLIWMEGQSAGWSYPSEISVLKPYVSKSASQPENPATTRTPQTAARTKTERNDHPHIYVSLPASRVRATQEETSRSSSLDEKADALYRRVQAFAEGQNTEEADTRYARSLDDMKQEYGTWLVQQRKKKKWGAFKKKALIAASVLVVTTTGFGVTHWISHRAGLKESPITSYALGTLRPAEKEHSTATVFHEPTNTVTTTTTAPKDTVVNTAPASKNTARPSATSKKKQPLKLKLVLPTDTAKSAVLPIPIIETPKPEVKKVVPLSRLVTVSGTLPDDKKESNATKVALQNNSNEVLKSVVVTVTYFKKEDRPLNTETIYFSNVQPGSAPVLKALGNRRATSARFEIGTIVRADGSLYLIH